MSKKVRPIESGFRKLGWALFALTQFGFFCLLVRNANMPALTDESDNMLGGLLIGNGQVIYRDFFSHHMPLPYYVSAWLRLAFDIRTPQGYRQALAFLTLIWMIALFFLLRRRFRSARFSFAFLGFEVLFLALLPRFSGYMLLAETLGAMALIPLLCYAIFDPALDFGAFDRTVVALCVFCAVMSSVLAIYPLFVCSVYYVYVRSRQFHALKAIHRPEFWGRELTFAAGILLPFALYAVYLVGTKSFNSFVECAFRFNVAHYAKFNPYAGFPFGALFEGWKGLAKQGQAFLSVLTTRKAHSTDLVHWVLLVVAGVNVAVLFRRDRARACFLAAFLFGCRLQLGFHCLPYCLCVAASCLFTLASPTDKQSARTAASPRRQRAHAAVLVYTALLLIASLHEFHAQSLRGAWHSNDIGDSFQSPYLEYIETLTKPGDTIWAAPLDPNLYVMSGRLPASYSNTYLPWQADDPAIETRVLGDLASTKPKLIFFTKDSDVWGHKLGEYGAPILAYIQKNYHSFSTNGLDANVYIRNDYFNDAWLMWSKHQR